MSPAPPIAPPIAPPTASPIASPAAPRRRIGRRRAVGAVGAALLLALTWPSSLGGALTLVAVAGHSMEPTYRTGDLLVVYPRRGYRPGDVIVYRVPAGDAGAGARVVHRIVAADSTGRFTTRGDNRRTTDAWRPTHSDVDGSPVLRLPVGARLLIAIRQPLPLAAVTGVLVFLAIALPSRPTHTSTSEEPSADDVDGLGGREEDPTDAVVRPSVG